MLVSNPSLHPRGLRRSLLLLLLTLTSCLGAAELSTGLTGSWTFVPERSTDLSPWRTATLHLSLDGSVLSIERTVKTGRRHYTENMVVDLAQPTSANPLEWWVDNRHLGAYAPHGGTRQISPTVLDDGQVLRLDMDYQLETSQGTRAVNTLRQFQLSPDGQILTVIDLRTTRPQPVVHVFQRSSE